MENIDTFDKPQIEEVVKSFFSVFTNSNNRQPDFDLLTKICIPEVLIINATEWKHVAYTLDSFIEPRKKILTDGTLVDFEELEIADQTLILGKIAQRHSIYVKSGLREGKPFKQKGHKLLHLTKTDEGWKITAVLWQDEA